MKKISLASDNYASTHPLVIQAILSANEGESIPYGGDPWTAAAQETIQHLFKRPCKTFFVPTGTGSNVFALKLCCRSHESVICAETAHINCQETGALEALVGCKLLPVKQLHGKITPEAVLQTLRREKAVGKHSTSPRVLSITQSTEFGTVYTLEELKALGLLCKQENLLFHMDGSRLYNAAASLELPLYEIAADLDILSLGGTKNGLMGAEALVIFNPILEEGSDHLQKQTLQLPSKMRYYSAQYLPFFENDLWRDLAQHANQKTREIAAILETIPEISINHPVETNQIFFSVPATWIPLIQERVHCYLWDMDINELRWITSWNTTDQDVEDVKNLLAEMARHGNI